MNFPASHPQRRTERTKAFSLVEVVLAMGVMSFALLGMVALLPMGLKTSHMAIDAMTQAQIMQYSRNQLELTPFNNLSAWDYSTKGTTLYFDNQGLPTVSTDPEQIYKVTFTVTGIPLNTNSTTSYPYATTNLNNSYITNNAMLVQVNIVNRTIGGASGTNTFPIYVPNAGF